MSNRIKDFVSGREAQICVAAALFAAVADWPYGYFQLLRWVVCVGAAFSAWRSFQEGGKWRAIGFLALALLFNPLKAIHFRREEWAWIDLLAGVAFLVLAPTERKEIMTAERITKLEAARRQLNVAIGLFFAGDYLSSLTLAGAAEEILGKLSGREGKPVSVEEIVDFHWDDTDPALTDKERRKVLLNVMNTPRNEAKHADDPDRTHYDVDRTFALQMIMRAMPMAKRLGAPPRNEAEMVEWVREHPEAME